MSRIKPKRTANELTRKQRTFVDWLATSKFERIPATQKALADELGVHETTLCRWRKQIAQDIINSQARELMITHVPDVFGSMIAEAKRGSYQHQKLFLEMVGELSSVEKHELGIAIRYINDWRHPEK